MAKGIHTTRPPIMGVTHMVSAGHFLAAAASYRILEQGGNAVDAGVASGIAINVVLPKNTNNGDVAPAIIYRAASDQVVTMSGLGRWPDVELRWWRRAAERGHELAAQNLRDLESQ